MCCVHAHTYKANSKCVHNSSKSTLTIVQYIPPMNIFHKIKYNVFKLLQ